MWARPPGYVGYEEGGQLTEAVRRRPYSVILLDEIEKAHSEVFNVLLQVLDDGRLTDNKGHVADFRNTIVIMTSNMGSEIIQERIEAIETFDDKALAAMKEDMRILLKQRLRPEFLNRDRRNRYVSSSWTRTDTPYRRYTVCPGSRRLPGRTRTFLLRCPDAARDRLAEHGYDPTFGARPLKRVLQREIANKLAEEILAWRIADGDRVHIDIAPDTAGLTFETVGRSMDEPAA